MDETWSLPVNYERNPDRDYGRAWHFSAPPALISLTPASSSATSISSIPQRGGGRSWECWRRSCKSCSLPTATHSANHSSVLAATTPPPTEKVKRGSSRREKAALILLFVRWLLFSCPLPSYRFLLNSSGPILSFTSNATFVSPPSSTPPPPHNSQWWLLRLASSISNPFGKSGHSTEENIAKSPGRQHFYGNGTQQDRNTHIFLWN